MNQKATTKDELFLLKLYELASKSGDIQQEIDRFFIGRSIGQNDRGANVIARDLAAANFIKKGEGSAVYLTDHGLRLVQFLLENNTNLRRSFSRAHQREEKNISDRMDACEQHHKTVDADAEPSCRR